MSEPIWQDRAACRTYDADLWFPGPNDHETRAFAKSICATCPVSGECLTTALENGEQYGIWGGVSIASYLRRGRRQRPRRGQGANHLRDVS